MVIRFITGFDQIFGRVIACASLIKLSLYVSINNRTKYECLQVNKKAAFLSYENNTYSGWKNKGILS